MGIMTRLAVVMGMVTTVTLWYVSVVTAFVPKASVHVHHHHPYQQQQQQSAPPRPDNVFEQSSVSSLSSSSSSSSSSSNTNTGTSVPTPPPLRRNPPRKICLMIEPTPFTHVSGYANRFQEMLKFLRKANDQVDILTVDSKTPAAELPKDFMGYKIEHTQGFTFPLYNHISLTVDLPEMKGARLLEDKESRPDLIHVTSPGFLLFAAIFYARVMCIPLVMSYHTHLPSYGKNYLGFVPYVEHICWELLRWAHSRADLTLVTSSQMKAELQANGIPRVDVWRKGIDTERFHPKFANQQQMRERMTNGNVNDFVMVYVGRLGAEKRLKDIKAMLELLNTPEKIAQRKGQWIRLCIVGTGPQEAELQEWFTDTPTVFTGQLRGDELSSAFASADVFIMPSDSETLGFVVLESMASGVPVIAANAGGIPDIIAKDEQTGYLVTPGDTETYVQHIERLARDSELRTTMGKAARAEAEKWGWEAATSYLRNVQYEKALINFHSRAFGGFGKPRTAGMFRLLSYRFRSFVKRYVYDTTFGKSVRSVWATVLQRLHLRKRTKPKSTDSVSV